MQRVDMELMVKSLMVSSEQNSSTQSQTSTEQQTFSEHEKFITGYLFAKLIILYANSFYLVYPSDKEVKFAKREYARRLGVFSQDDIDQMLKHLSKLMVSYERDDKIFREPNMPAIMGLLETAFKRDRSHQLFLPVPPESKEEKAARIELGMKNCESILNMFGDEE